MTWSRSFAAKPQKIGIRLVAKELLDRIGSRTTEDLQIGSHFWWLLNNVTFMPCLNRQEHLLALRIVDVQVRVRQFLRHLALAPLLRVDELLQRFLQDHVPAGQQVAVIWIAREKDAPL